MTVSDPKRSFPSARAACDVRHDRFHAIYKELVRILSLVATVAATVAALTLSTTFFRLSLADAAVNRTGTAPNTAPSRQPESEPIVAIATFAGRETDERHGSRWGWNNNSRQELR
jgi:hypothetical protein